MLDETKRPKDIEAIPELPHPSKKVKVGMWVAAVALVVIAVGLLRIFTWAFDNKPVLEINNSPFPTRTIREHPAAGGVVFLDADYCKHKQVEGELRISFLSESREVFLPLTKERSDARCQRIEFPILIPKDISPGIYKVKFRAVYNKNPLKQGEIVEFESREFEIDPTTSE